MKPNFLTMLANNRKILFSKGREQLPENVPVFGWGFVGFLWGLLLAFGSLVLAGAGHGWTSAWPFGFLSIFIVPLTTIAWGRRKSNGSELAVIALAIGLISDFLLVLATSYSEGLEGFYRVMPAAIVWIVLWIAWQLLAVAASLYRSLK